MLSLYNDFLEDVPIERQIGYQPLQSGVLVPQLPEFTNLEKPQVAIALLQDAKGRLADPHLPTHIRHRLSRGGLPGGPTGSNPGDQFRRLSPSGV
jgi:hypothetical protein